MFCTQTEEFLREKGVDFAIRNIADDDEEAIAELQRMGTMTTPVTVVGGTDIVVGFDRNKLEQSLGL
ncbi:MAG TPA: glutaredoxin family protein [Rubrobacteraceae bacterium]|nr:glutaredoxin family protein [Rubrobacteraceae bacterium]